VRSKIKENGGKGCEGRNRIRIFIETKNKIGSEKIRMHCVKIRAQIRKLRTDPPRNGRPKKSAIFMLLLIHQVSVDAWRKNKGPTIWDIVF